MVERCSSLDLTSGRINLEVGAVCLRQRKLQDITIWVDSDDWFADGSSTQGVLHYFTQAGFRGCECCINIQQSGAQRRLPQTTGFLQLTCAPAIARRRTYR